MQLFSRKSNSASNPYVQSQYKYMIKLIEDRLEGKKIGSWRVDVDQHAGSVLLRNDMESVIVAFTPFWNGLDWISVQMIAADYSEAKDFDPVPYTATDDADTDLESFTQAINTYLKGRYKKDLQTFSKKYPHVFETESSITEKDLDSESLKTYSESDRELKVGDEVQVVYGPNRLGNKTTIDKIIKPSDTDLRKFPGSASTRFHLKDGSVVSGANIVKASSSINSSAMGYEEFISSLKELGFKEDRRPGTSRWLPEDGLTYKDGSVRSTVTINMDFKGLDKVVIYGPNGTSYAKNFNQAYNLILDKLDSHLNTTSSLSQIKIGKDDLVVQLSTNGDRSVGILPESVLIVWQNAPQDLDDSEKKGYVDELIKVFKDQFGTSPVRGQIINP